MTSVAPTLIVALTLAALMHWWPRLEGAWRRRVSLLTSALGIAFMVAALRAEGQREAALTSWVLVGPATLTATASALASLYYYVLCGVCFLLGFAGLALGEPLSRWLRPRPVQGAVAVAWLLTLTRFLLEKSAAPGVLSEAVGVSWLPPFAGALVATAGPAPPAWRQLARRLVAYAALVRGAVAALGVVATRGRLGTHYDVSGLTSVDVALSGVTVAFEPASWSQILWLNLLPQMLPWVAYTVALGLAGAALAVRLAPVKLKPPRAAVPTSEPDRS